MFLRVISFRVKPESLGRFEELCDSSRKPLSGISGMQRCFGAVDESGNAVVIGVWDSEDAATKAQPALQAVWAALSEHMAEQPRPTEYKSGYTLK